MVCAQYNMDHVFALLRISWMVMQVRRRRQLSTQDFL